MRVMLDRNSWGRMKRLVLEFRYLPDFLEGKAPSYQNEYINYDDYGKPVQSLYAGNKALMAVVFAIFTTVLGCMYPEEIIWAVRYSVFQPESLYPIVLIYLLTYVLIATKLAELATCPWIWFNNHRRHIKSKSEKICLVD